MNPASLLSLKPAFKKFKDNHPKFIPFLKAASKETFLDEGSLIEITVTNSQGKTCSTNLRVNTSDLEFFRGFRRLFES